MHWWPYVNAQITDNCRAASVSERSEANDRVLLGHGTYKGDPNCASMDCVDLVLVLGSGFGVDFIL